MPFSCDVFLLCAYRRFTPLHVRVGDFTSSRIGSESVLPQVYAQHVVLFDGRGLWWSVDEPGARAVTVRVQHEFRRVQAALGISAFKPVWNVGQ